MDEWIGKTPAPSKARDALWLRAGSVVNVAARSTIAKESTARRSWALWL